MMRGNGEERIMKIHSHLDDETLDVFVVAQGKAEGAARLHVVKVVVSLSFGVQLRLKAERMVLSYSPINVFAAETPSWHDYSRKSTAMMKGSV